MGSVREQKMGLSGQKLTTCKEQAMIKAISVTLNDNFWRGLLKLFVKTLSKIKNQWSYPYYKDFRN